MKKIIFLICVFLSTQINAQISGNQAYSNSNYNYSYNNNPSARKNTIVGITDSTYTISSSILMNKLPDFYMITLGLNQEEKTIPECNQQINKRIKALKTDLKSIDIKEEDVYVDFISQTKIYDHVVEGKNVEQVETGFEIKKNVIIKMKNIDDFDALIELSAKQEIYDIVKVEYINDDVDEIYEEMYKEVITFIEKRKNLYQKTTDIQFENNKRIVGDNFYSIYPKTQYKQYTAFESSNLYTYNSHYSESYHRKEARKNKTFYYDGLGHSGYDKVINSHIPNVSIQYVLMITVVYDIK